MVARKSSSCAVFYLSKTIHVCDTICEFMLPVFVLRFESIYIPAASIKFYYQKKIEQSVMEKSHGFRRQSIHLSVHPSVSLFLVYEIKSKFLSDFSENYTVCPSHN